MLLKEFYSIGIFTVEELYLKKKKKKNRDGEMSRSNTQRAEPMVIPECLDSCSTKATQSNLQGLPHP